MEILGSIVRTNNYKPKLLWFGLDKNLNQRPHVFPGSYLRSYWHKGKHKGRLTNIDILITKKLCRIYSDSVSY